MKYVSTRQKSPAATFSEAVQISLAPDGGLYVPEAFPRINPNTFTSQCSLSQIASRLLSPYLQGDPLHDSLEEICDEAFNFSVDLRRLKGETAILELFHGPTAAFKDVGARFLASCLTRIAPTRSAPRLVLVATSGDTGAAVAAAFHGKAGHEVAILFPKGRISPRQEKQLTCWGGNVRAFAVRGTFDDCQRMAKAAFQDPHLSSRFHLLSANSISIGRLLPQQVYYAMASLRYFEQGRIAPNFLIPTGNLGNAVAALWAKRIGFPINQVVLVTNANRAIPDYFTTGKWAPQPTVATLANAMDVGNASNMERIFHLYPEGRGLQNDVQALSVSDAEIREAITGGNSKWGADFCPHTATAVFAREKFTSPNWIIVATAHPAKFDAIVEPLVGHAVTVPPALSDLLARPSHSQEIDPSSEAFSAVL